MLMRNSKSEIQNPKFRKPRLDDPTDHSFNRKREIGLQDNWSALDNNITALYYFR